VNRADELEEIIRAEPWMMQQLAIARDLHLPDWFIGAGAVRDLVWDVRYGSGFEPEKVADIDLVYFDPADLSHETEVAIEARLPDHWDVKNQARVHLWFPAKFGMDVEPLTSSENGISTWPEHATCVGIRLEDDDSLIIAAPHGLDALLDGVWSRNAARVSPEEYERRLRSKDPGQRWSVDVRV
jgi:hypothetical protein